ncbi:MAG: type II secretion system GspH family protein [Phycisphaerae bacterium]|nr:type II secretion system GspH family protein [Phycisphaerae bacterium]
MPFSDQRAFSLVELMVSIALIGVIALAVSFSTGNSHQRAGEMKVQLATLQNSDIILDNMVQDMKWATEMRFFLVNTMPMPIGLTYRFVFISPDPAGSDNSTTVEYYWNAQKDLFRSVDGSEPVLLQTDVRLDYFAMSGDIITLDGTDRLDGVHVVYEVPSNNTSFGEYVSLVNTPVFN